MPGARYVGFFVEFCESLHVSWLADRCVCVRVQSSTKPGQLTYEQVAALKDVKDMTEAERRGRDVCGSYPWVDCWQDD